MIYLDNAATSYPKPPEVTAAVTEFLKEIGVNAGRGAYRQALKADELVWRTRMDLGKLFNISDPQRIIFTANVTEAINLSLKGLLNKGGHVITSNMEHNAVWRVLKRLEKENGVEISAVPVSLAGEVDLNNMESMIRKDTRRIIMLHASNVTGTILPIRQIAQVARRHSIPLLIDAAQTAGCLPLDVKELNIDMLAFTGHKGLLGPMGTGGLYIRDGVKLETLKEGGTGGDSIMEEMPGYLPDRYEAGTQNIPSMAGLGLPRKCCCTKGLNKSVNMRKSFLNMPGGNWRLRIRCCFTVLMTSSQGCL